jgi:hypothetical protein
MFPGSTFRATRRAQRQLLRLVDDAHAALADFADDAKITELPQSGRWHRGRFRNDFLAVFLDLLDFHHGREQFTDVVGQVGIAVDVLSEAGMFTGSVTGGELVGESGEQYVVGGAVGGFVRHLRVLPACWRGSP